MLPADMRSKAGGDITNRGLRAMQNEQQLGCRSPAMPNSTQSASGRKAGGHSAFANNSKWVRNPQNNS